MDVTIRSSREIDLAVDKAYFCESLFHEPH